MARRGWGSGGSWGKRWGSNAGGGSTTRRTTSTRRTDRSAVDYDIASNRAYNPATYEGYYRATPEQSAARTWWTQNVNPAERTHSAFSSFMGGGAPPGFTDPLAPAGPGGGGGGGWGGGGGGGGGGGAMTQAMFDAMLNTLGTRGPQLALQQANLPDFRGTNIPGFNAAPYTQLSNNLATAVARDRAAIQSGANQTTAALGAYSANPYAAAQAAPPPQAQAQGAALQATAEGAANAPDANAAAAGAASAQSGAETAAFNDLLKVLGANYGQAQNSRLSQVQMDAQSARNQLGAQQLGLGSQIGMQRANAYEQWRQQDAERRYQNSLMSQQWQREEMTRNQDIYNQQAQGNWQQRNEMINNRLTPLLQLIQGTAGTKVNMDALTKMLAGLAA
jgi:hypothetical protein